MTCVLLFKFKLINTYNKRKQQVKVRGAKGAIVLTAGGTSAIVAKKSQTRPFHGKTYKRSEEERRRITYLVPEELP
jgi:hypothetical protein